MLLRTCNLGSSGKKPSDVFGLARLAHSETLQKLLNNRDLSIHSKAIIIRY